MIRTIGVFLALIAVAHGVAAAGFVVICPVNGMIDDGVAVLVQRAVREASGAEAIVFVVDTPGGRVDSAIAISKSILDAPCRTIAYIEGMGAISAGALISFSCQDMIMAPDTNMGAAAPVVMSPQGTMPTGEKEVSYVRARMRALAERNGHNPDIAAAMVDKDIELRAYTNDLQELVVYARGFGAVKRDKPARERTQPQDFIEDLLRRAFPSPTEEETEPESVEELPEQEAAPTEDRGEVVLPSGKLLTLTPQEAIRYGVIPATAESLDDALAYYNYAGLERVRVQMTWSESLFRWLTSPIVAGLLLMLGIGGLYMEIRTPGFGFPGIIGIVCLGLFFGAHYLIGLAEVIDILLVGAGVALILLEIFAFPGFGIPGIAGIVCLIAGFYLSLTDFTFPEYSWQYDRLREIGWMFVVAFATLVLFFMACSLILPRTPMRSRLILEQAQLADQGYTVQTAAQHDEAIGLKGVALTMLRPAGRGRFKDKTYQVVSRGEYIRPGTPIVIVQAEGNRYVVDPLEEDKAQ